MNKYSDSGYRFRYNEFERQDGPYYPKNTKDSFFDYIFYSSDSFPTPPKSSPHLIAEMYFRLQIDQISHGRNVFTLMDFIGTLGGVSGLLLEILGWVFGGYATFHSGFATLAALYKVKQNGPSIFLPTKKVSTENPDLVKLKIPQSTKILLFFLQSPCGCLFRPFKKPIHDQYL
jgi:hypothetical protein